MKTLTGYYDSLRGLVPCRLLAWYTPLFYGPMDVRESRPSPQVKLEVTQDRGVYKKGDIIETTPFCFVKPVGPPLAMMCRQVPLTF